MQNSFYFFRLECFLSFRFGGDLVVIGLRTHHILRRSDQQEVFVLVFWHNSMDPIVPLEFLPSTDILRGEYS